ncbi:Fcf2 domain-containing protein [Aspergillus mulundensis]|uniref:Fcf2 pre-rRNA processing C-terminal domain-containing protein n=1 Tax=Aspergillus mulundensis TaxID=1810919 RepID=A0A3D8QBQ0_9EURO|nr:hypothetical protein DSM5745_11101 [Aspergillus mulundensis]RDW59273.1 hypothetical protein DSM5745_11101 [Aspergillus mulundensis]
MPSTDHIDLTDASIQQLLAEAEQRLRKDRAESANCSVALRQPDEAIPNIPKLSTELTLKPYVRHHNDIAVIDTTRMIDPLTNNNMQPLACGRAASRSSSKKDKPTAGSDWFDLPKTELTPELKRDLQILRMRSILDPKRHYKKENGKAQPPKYSQVGTIIEGPVEFFSGRIAKRDRKKTFVEEALDMEKENKRFEARYNAVQDKKRSGKKAFYKSLVAKRTGGKNQR